MNWIEHRCDMSPSFFCCDLIWCDDVRIRAKNHNSKPKAHTWISRRAKRLIGLDYKNAKCPSERNSNQNRRVKNNSKQMAIERQRNEQRIDGSVLIWKLFFCCYDWFLSERTKKMQLLLFHWRIHFFSQSDFFAVVPFYSFSLLCLLVSLFSTFVLESVVCNALFTRKKQLRSNEVKRTTSKTTVHQMRNWGPKKNRRISFDAKRTEFTKTFEMIQSSHTTAKRPIEDSLIRKRVLLSPHTIFHSPFALCQISRRQSSLSNLELESSKLTR